MCLIGSMVAVKKQTSLDLVTLRYVYLEDCAEQAWVCVEEARVWPRGIYPLKRGQALDHCRNQKRIQTKIAPKMAPLYVMISRILS
jgi:hypothetical protein